MVNRSDFVDFREAQARTGLSSRALERRIASGICRAFRDPLDHRRRIVPVEDLDRLTAPVPITQGRPEPVTAA